MNAFPIFTEIMLLSADVVSKAADRLLLNVTQVMPQ